MSVPFYLLARKQWIHFQFEKAYSHIAWQLSSVEGEGEGSRSWAAEQLSFEFLLCSTKAAVLPS